MTRAYRIYYTTFYDDIHKKIVEALKATIGIEPIEHKSFIKEFRYIEFKSDELKPGMEGEIAKVIKTILGESANVKIDFINI